MLSDSNYERCTGCTACESVCPKKCIKMVSDDTGFEYPVVEEENCISCGLCQKACPIDHVIFHNESNKAYAYQNRDEIRAKSTSGGFFTRISDYILEKKGSVYGAVFDENFAVKHIRAVTPEERNRMRYSKYVQSLMIIWGYL